MSRLTYQSIFRALDVQLEIYSKLGNIEVKDSIKSTLTKFLNIFLSLSEKIEPAFFAKNYTLYNQLIDCRQKEVTKIKKILLSLTSKLPHNPYMTELIKTIFINLESDVNRCPKCEIKLLQLHDEIIHQPAVAQQTAKQQAPERQAEQQAPEQQAEQQAERLAKEWGETRAKQRADLRADIQADIHADIQVENQTENKIEITKSLLTKSLLTKRQILRIKQREKDHNKKIANLFMLSDFTNEMHQMLDSLIYDNTHMPIN